MPDFIIGTSAFANANDQLIRSAGIGWVRADFPVPFEGRLGGTLSEAYLRARQEAQAWQARGLKVIGVTPLPGIGQYQPDAQGAMQLHWTDFFPSWMGATASPAYYRNYSDICAFLAEDNRGAVQAWQIANELDILQFAGPLNPYQAWDLIVYGAQGAKKGNPAALVGTNTAGSPVSYYLYGRLATENRVRMDYCGIDQYYGTWQPGGPELWEARIAEIYALTGGMKVMVNEWGFASQGELLTPQEAALDLPNCQFKKWRYSWGAGHTWENQAAFVHRAFDAFLVNREKLFGICFYRWEDQVTCWQCGKPDCPMETAWGLVTVDNVPKPAYQAFLDGVSRL